MNRLDLLKEFFVFIKKFKKQLLLSIIVLLLLTGLEIITPLVAGYILQDKLGVAVELANFSSIAFLIIAYGILGLIQSIFSYLSNLNFYKFANLISLEIRKDIYSHIQELPMSFYDKTASGKIVTRITNDTNSVRDFFKVSLSEFLSSGAYIVFTSLFLLFTNPWAIIFVIIPLPLIYFLVKIYDRKSIGPLKKYRKSLSQLNSDINENIRGMDVIRTANVEEGVREEFEKESQYNYDLGMKFERLNVFLGGSNLTNMFARFNTLAILLLFIKMNISGNTFFTIGLMYVLIEYTERVYNATSRIMVRFEEFEKSMAATEHIFEILHLERENPGTSKGTLLHGNVEFKNLSFYYINEDYVLKDISFKVEKGDEVALIGQTGSGKSSIINLLFRFYQEQKGEILFDGRNANSISKRDIRSNMAIVLQEPYIYKASLRNNISLGREYPDKDIYEALIRVGGKNLFDNLEDGLDTELSEGGSSLSQGEKQIITFARAIIRDPKILVLDEATSSVDSETEQYIQKGLDALKKGRTTFVIAHRLSTIIDSDLILVMKDGYIVERGKHQELLEKNGLYKQMLEAEKK